jgi:iron(III) transport system substrate-binding protein
MKASFRARVALVVVLTSLVNGVGFAVSSAGADVLKAKRDAEGKGYAFLTSRDDILVNARKEGRLRVLAEMQAPTIKVTTRAFMQKYPFISLHIEEIRGADAGQRVLLELKAGMARDWDILHVSTSLYSQYLPYLWKVDLCGMAAEEVLAIPPKMIDPKNRNAVSYFSRFQVTAYDGQVVGADRLPKSWEDFLKPDLKWKKFAVDIDTTSVAALVPAWGLEKTLEFARRIAAQNPIWVRGGTRTLTAILAGEIPLFLGANFTAVSRAQRKDPKGRLRYAVLEPVPVRFAMPEAIMNGAKHTNAALLWLEWMASAEAQKLIDEHEPLASSIHVRGGAVERETRGKRISEMNWDYLQNLSETEAKVFEAYGFPKAEAKN